MSASATQGGHKIPFLQQKFFLYWRYQCDE